MARADLIVDLVKYASSGNKAMVKKVTEAMLNSITEPLRGSFLVQIYAVYLLILLYFYAFMS